MMHFVGSILYLSSHNILLTVVILILISWVFLRQKRRKRNLPPGPIGLPLIGCAPRLAVGLYRNGYAPEKLFAKMSRQYGDVFSIYVGTQLVVVVSSYKAITEAFQNALLSGRPRSVVLEETTMDKGEGFASGKTWWYQRKFTQKTFRGFQVGKTSFEEPISQGGTAMVKVMQEHKGLPFDPHVLIGNCVANIICAVVLGKHYHHADPQFFQILDIIESIMNKLGSGALVAYIPILRYILPKRYNELKSAFSDFVNFVDGIRKEHVSEFSAVEGSQGWKDFIDVFLNEIALHADNKDISPYINNTSLVATTVVLFLAGTDTSTSTLRWALLYMMSYPEIQTKIQKEMDSVIGRNRGPQWADKSKLPYTEAVLLEVQRIRTIGPLGVPHCATEDTTLLGYDIPEGAIVVGNIWAVHNDGDVWKEPDQFRPERFLDVEGKLRTRAEYMPFSVGRRSCLGENLAKMEVFILFTQIIHAFNISFPKDTRYTLEGVNGITYGPKPFEIVAEKRD